MPKYLVTSGSHFTPFTYDELAKPLMQVQEAHNAAQDAYDTLNMETSALRNYISDNEQDSDAKRLYDNYMDKLSSLQQNLWDRGYNAGTRRNLGAARAAYASDVTRLANAIKTRQERSQEYWDARHKNPDLVTGRDPGLSGLNDYLRDTEFGRNWYSYNGQTFMQEVGADAKARASEMLRNPGVVKDPRLEGYLLRIEKYGYTGEEVQKASDAVRAYYSGNASALDGLDEASSILANTLISHVNSTGAQRGVNVDNNEFDRLVGYGISGLSQAIGQTRTDTVKDLVWADMMDKRNYAWKQQYSAAQKAAAKKKEEEASMKMEDTNTKTVSGRHPKRIMRRTKEYDTATTKLAFAPNGQEVHNNVEASELVYSGALRRRAYQQLGFDIGRTPNGSSESNYLNGVIGMDGKKYFTRYNPNAKTTGGKKGAVEYSESGKVGTWIPSPGLTQYYRDARSEYERVRDSFMESEIGGMAGITPDKQYDDYKKYGISFDTPLTEFRGQMMNSPQYGGQTYDEVYVTRDGYDSGKYLDKFSALFTKGINFDGDNAKKIPHRRSYKGTTDYIHPMTEYGTVGARAIKDPDDVFKFKDGKITNIRDIKLTADSILDEIDNGQNGSGYFIVTTNDNKEYAISVDMMQSDSAKRLFAAERKKMLDAIEYANNDPMVTDEALERVLTEYAKELSYLLKTTYGYSLNTRSQSGTESKVEN